MKSSGEVSVDSIKETLFKLKIRQEELDGEARHYRDGIITKEKMLKKMEDKKGIVYYTDKLSTNITMFKQNPRIKYIKHDFEIKEDKPKVNTFQPDIDKLSYQKKATKIAITQNIIL